MKRVYRSEKPDTFVEFDPRTGEIAEGRIDKGLEADWDDGLGMWMVTPSLPCLAGQRFNSGLGGTYEASKEALATLDPVPPRLRDTARLANSLASIVDQDLGISLRADTAFDLASMIIEKTLDTENEGP